MCSFGLGARTADQIDEQVLSIIWQGSVVCQCNRETPTCEPSNRCHLNEQRPIYVSRHEKSPLSTATSASLRSWARPPRGPLPNRNAARRAFSLQTSQVSNRVPGPDRQRPSSGIDATTTCTTATDGVGQDVWSRWALLCYLTAPEKPHLKASGALETTRPSAVLCSKSTENQSRKTSP